jgi:geranylgeranyl diphosphate synthase type II
VNRFDFNEYVDRLLPRIEQALTEILDTALQTPGCPARLAEAMRYAVLGGGKRIRPLLVLATLRTLGHREEIGLPAAAALEIVHAYSLIHDDLPAMDNDDVRRGKPSCHRAFGEALAILAGDALLTLAFEVLATALPKQHAGAAIQIIAHAAGPAGMVGGQADDVDERAHAASVDQVESIHRRKTGALIVAAIHIGGLLGRARTMQLQALLSFGQNLGLAFQIADDVLAHTGDERRLMKPTKSDQQHGRRTYPRMAGIKAARMRAAELTKTARDALKPFKKRADVLLGLIDVVEERMSGKTPNIS